MSACFCTIITASHIGWARNLNHSIKKFDAGVVLHVLVADANGQKDVDWAAKEGIKLYDLQEVVSNGLPIAAGIVSKYKNSSDELRWSLKPVLISYLLQKGHTKVLYADCDLYFFNSYAFLFRELDTSNVILSPHWRCSKPYLLENEKDSGHKGFEHLFTSGIYNGGFVGVNKQGLEAMDWWAHACHYVCVKEPSRGFFVDQTHLNLLPVLFENVLSLKHRGCNIADWNRTDCQRIQTKDGVVMINNNWEIVFIHFTTSTIRSILNNFDPLLKPHLNEFATNMKQFDPTFSLDRYLPGVKKDQKNKSPLHRFRDKIFKKN